MTDFHIAILPDTSGGESVIAIEVEETPMRMLDGTPVVAKVLRPIFLGHRPDGEEVV